MDPGSPADGRDLSLFAESAADLKTFIGAAAEAVVALLEENCTCEVPIIAKGPKQRSSSVPRSIWISTGLSPLSFSNPDSTLAVLFLPHWCDYLLLFSS